MIRNCILVLDFDYLIAKLNVWNRFILLTFDNFNRWLLYRGIVPQGLLPVILSLFFSIDHRCDNVPNLHPL
jgi:hypothetical protein